MTELLIGTSGWSYNEWSGVFYPSSSTNKLTYYSKVFHTVEIDSTFYAYPSKGLVMGWSRNTPDDFVFCPKLPQLITHEKKLGLENGVTADLTRFLGLMKPLIAAGKLGPILIQLPPSFNYDEDFGRLDRFLSMAPEDIMFAVEFRHPSWLRPESWALLRAHKVANVIVDEPLLPPDVVVTADFSFVRWHGRGTKPWYNYRYTKNELETWAPKVKEAVRLSKKTFGYFNNHFKGFAVENALQMMKILGTSSPKQDEVAQKATNFINGAPVDSGEGSMLEFIGEKGK